MSGENLVRYGVTWGGGLSDPLLTETNDGYWTPWHIAAEELARATDDRLAALRLANELTLETQTVEEAVASLVSMVRDARAQRDALAAFKSYVHARLDAAGIPANPGGPHSEAGCRIGDRLDIALAKAPPA